MTTALVRGVASTFDRAIVGSPGTRIDVELARRQHAEYCRQLEASGYVIEIIPSNDEMPDCVFVEDIAVILEGLAVLTRPGADARRAEVTGVAKHLAHLPSVSIEAPGTLDGGDVMRMGDTVFVGLSGRSNRSGVDQLTTMVKRRGLRPVIVPVTGALHLKSAVLPVDETTVVVTRGAVDTDLLDGLRIVFEDEDERFRFSALPLLTRDVLVTTAAPRTAERVASLGLVVMPLDISEILAADGGLTCMSILY